MPSNDLELSSAATRRPTVPAPADTSEIDVPTLVDLIQGDCEFALVDVREDWAQAEDGYIIHSVPLALSRLELRAANLLRRTGVLVVVVDDGGDALARRGAAKLRELGFTEVKVLTGGVAAWRAAGYTVYNGAGAYSKAFGEFVEAEYGTPHITARDLAQRIEAGEKLVVLDGRTAEEFERFSIPGALSLPNAELPYRVSALLPAPCTTVVVNCAGRTRSIIGAQGLINAGVKNPVMALEGGTMAWLLEGYKLDRGAAARLPDAPAAAELKALDAVRRLTRRFGIPWISDVELKALERKADEQALYVVDVRTRQEFEAGHLPGSSWVEGGQLVQGIESHIGVRHSRVVVVDDASGVRAAITASWLRQLGWAHVYAHAAAFESSQVQTGPAPSRASAPPADVPTIGVSALHAAITAGSVTVLDVGSSLDYEAGHIPGARFAIRVRLPEVPDRLPDGPVVITSSDGALAAWAAQDLIAAGRASVRALAGGTFAWRAAGLALETQPVHWVHAPEDVVRNAYQRKTESEQHAAFRAYLAWELDLLHKVRADATVRFHTFQ